MINRNIFAQASQSFDQLTQEISSARYNARSIISHKLLGLLLEEIRYSRAEYSIFANRFLSTNEPNRSVDSCTDLNPEQQYFTRRESRLECIKHLFKKYENDYRAAQTLTDLEGFSEPLRHNTFDLARGQTILPTQTDCSNSHVLRIFATLYNLKNILIVPGAFNQVTRFIEHIVLLFSHVRGLRAVFVGGRNALHDKFARLRSMIIAFGREFRSLVGLCRNYEVVSSRRSENDRMICAEPAFLSKNNEGAQHSRLNLISTAKLRSIPSTSITGLAETSSRRNDIQKDSTLLHIPLAFQIPEEKLREAMLASRSTGKAYWQYTLYENAIGTKVSVHYCRSKEATERIVELFMDQKVIGFDIEWKAQAFATEGIKKNVSLIQVASEERIALFHIARYSKGDAIDDLVGPSLRKLMESPTITKVGVSIKSDCTRLRKFMGIECRGLFELSHLYKLVKYSPVGAEKIDKRLVALARQVEEHLQLPLWKGEVRSSDWSEALTYQQVQYAASDSYAGLQLFDVMEGKRKHLNPTPPRPEHAELNLPIRLANGETIATRNEPEEECNEVASTNESRLISAEEMTNDSLNMKDEDMTSSECKNDHKAARIVSVTLKGAAVVAAEEWVKAWRCGLPETYKAKAAPASLRAYALWHHQRKEVDDIVKLLRDPPLEKGTVANYILKAISLEKLPVEKERLRSVFWHLPPFSRRHIHR